MLALMLDSKRKNFDEFLVYFDPLTPMSDQDRISP